MASHNLINGVHFMLTKHQPYENVIKERTDLTGMKLLLWADNNLPLAPPNKFESFVNQLRVVLQPKVPFLSNNRNKDQKTNTNNTKLLF